MYYRWGNRQRIQSGWGHECASRSYRNVSAGGCRFDITVYRQTVEARISILEIGLMCMRCRAGYKRVLVQEGVRAGNKKWNVVDV